MDGVLVCGLVAVWSDIAVILVREVPKSLWCDPCWLCVVVVDRGERGEYIVLFVSVDSLVEIIMLAPAGCAMKEPPAGVVALGPPSLLGGVLSVVVVPPPYPPD